MKLTRHLAKVCMKNSTTEERQVELQRAKESMREWTWEARTWDYKEMCKRYHDRPTRLALLEDLLRMKFFVASAPQPEDLEASDGPSISATTTLQAPTTPSVGCSNAEVDDDEEDSLNSSAGSSDPAWMKLFIHHKHK